MAHDDLIERAKYEPLRRSPPEPVASALETMPYGLYIVGSRSESGERNGMMADWVMQVSFKPRLLAVSLENDSTTLRFVRETGVFSVNVLPAEEHELARHFAQPRDASKIKGRSDEEAAKVYDKLAEVPHREGEQTGCALLDGALAWVECRARDFVSAGDHTLVIGEVLDGALLRDGDAMTQKTLGWTYAG